MDRSLNSVDIIAMEGIVNRRKLLSDRWPHWWSTMMCGAERPTSRGLSGIVSSYELHLHYAGSTFPLCQLNLSNTTYSVIKFITMLPVFVYHVDFSNVKCGHLANVYQRILQFTQLKWGAQVLFWSGQTCWNLYAPPKNITHLSMFLHGVGLLTHTGCFLCHLK